MALKSAKLSDIPKGERPICKDEAVDFQLHIMETLCPESRRFFLKCGKFFTSVACGATCVYLHAYYRRSVDVSYIGRIYSVIPAVFIPALSNMGLHKLLIRDNILVQRWACPMCYQIRSGLLNLSFGVIYPLIVTPIIAFSYARRLKTYDLPPLNSKKIWNFALSKTKPISGRLGIFACIQFLFGAVIAELEARENNYFNKNINRFIDEYMKRQARAKLKSGEPQVPN